MLGGILAAVSAGVLIALQAFAGAIVIAALYVGMLAVRFAAGPGRLRLGLLAGLMIAIAAVALISVLTVAAAAAV